MPSAPVRQPSFSGGEIAPYLYSRTDINRYEISLRTMRNFFAMRHGGATQRPGTQYIATTLNGGAQVRLIPFIFNETGLGQSYVLEFGNQYIAFYQNGGQVVSGGNPYTIATPYLQADLQNLRFTEVNDVITIVHPSYAPMELKRLGPTNWTLTGLTLYQAISGGAVTGLSMGGTAGTPVPWNNYIIEAINILGEGTLGISLVPGAANQFALASASTPVNLVWTVPANGSAVYYKVYRFTQVGVGAPPWANGPYGYIGQTTSNRFTDGGITPDFTQAPAIFNNPFAGGAGTYPAAVGIVQQRRVFASSNNNPLGFWISVPGDFSNFDYHIPTVASDGITGSLFSDEANAIQHILELRFMLMLTSGSEIYVQGDGTGVVKPGAVNAATQSQYGSSALRPIKVADVVLFNQALGSFIRDFTFDFAIDGYRGNDITIFASHLFEGFTLSDWAYQKIPDSIVWAVRSDGVLLSCTYVREQQVLAWARHDFTNGIVENICAIPENGAYAVYLSIKRVINGSTVRYIERLSSRLWSDEISATYLDCFSSFNGVNAAATTMTLVPPGGGFDQSANAYKQQITLQASAGLFTPSMVGQVIILSDAAFASGIGSQGPDGTLAFLGAGGNQIQCFIQAYSSSTLVTITPSGAVPVTLQNVPVTTWAQAVKTVSGLGYLAGQTVSVWADRFVVASPNNTDIPTKYVVPASGSITLDKWYSTVYVGLPMIADLQPLDLETSFGETLQSRRKRVAKLGITTYKTRTFKAGAEDPDLNVNNINSDPCFELFEFQRGEKQTGYDTPPELATDQDYVLLEAHWNRNGRVFIRNVDPSPCTILGISPFGEDAAPIAWAKKGG